MRTILALTRFELKKLWRQKKNLIGALNVVLINGLFIVAFYMTQFKRADKAVREAPDFTYGEFLNVNTYTQVILAPSANMLFPMVLSVIAGYMLAGEFELGNLRMMMFRPISRWQMMLSKFFALSVYGAALLAFLLVCSYITSNLLFTHGGPALIPGEMFRLETKVVVLSADEMPFRLVMSYILAIPMVASVGAMALMFAVITRHFVSAAILTSTVYFCSQIVGSLPMLSSIHPYLPTSYWTFYGKVLEPTIPWDTIALHAGWTAAYTGIFLAIGITSLNMRDV